jgi:hypothetical protein
VPATPPEAASRPVPGYRDDLSLIRGIDADLAGKLEALGVVRYAQIAAWQREDVRRIAAALELGRQISQQNWIEQAEILAVRYAPKPPPPAPPVHAAMAAVAAVAKAVNAAAAPSKMDVFPSAQAPAAGKAGARPRLSRVTLDLADVVRLLRSNAPARQAAERLVTAAARSIAGTLPPPITPPELVSEIALPAESSPVTAIALEPEVVAGLETFAVVEKMEQPVKAAPEIVTDHAIAAEPVAAASTPAPVTASPDDDDVVCDAKPLRPVHEVVHERIARLEAEITALSPELAPAAAENSVPRSGHPDDADVQIVMARRPAVRATVHAKAIEPAMSEGRARLVRHGEVEEAAVIINGKSASESLPEQLPEPQQESPATRRPELASIAGLRQLVGAWVRKPV